MKRIAMAAVTTLALPAALIAPATAAHASTTVCDPHSTTYAGACYTLSTYVKHETVVEAVPVENKKKTVTVTAHCDFSETITRSWDASASITASAKGTIFGAVEVGVSATVSLSVSQTATTATDIGGTFKLKPGQSVLCERIYTYIATTVTEHDYTGSKTSTKSYTVHVPSSLGVRFA